LQRVAQQLSVDIPSFRDLSERLGLKTSNLKKDRAIEKAGEVGSSIAAGTSFLGGVLGTLIDTNQNQPRSRSTKAQPKTKNRMNKVINGKSKMCFWPKQRERKRDPANLCKLVKVDFP